ncbi:hypothetical protein SAMN02745163_02090 [Clostridium cavendishii DSM 21758]|uniref:Uncharacterized protein n=1 Tax=Clostridium cavendishii DSM 21758 TaxID=1121302 RepID=A0A1M6K3U4_9CLOT|nr:hypothetical protein [Clostridium cavendishii]SHJ53641.1 hypothetical protein SAMN02745163_02090 [Clostridium cavendishii DSM 21758]
MVDRIEKVATLYIQSHYNVKEMSLPELMKLFDETCEEIIEIMRSTNKN